MEDLPLLFYENKYGWAVLTTDLVLLAQYLNQHASLNTLKVKENQPSFFFFFFDRNFSRGRRCIEAIALCTFKSGSGRSNRYDSYGPRVSFPWIQRLLLISFFTRFVRIKINLAVNTIRKSTIIPIRETQLRLDSDIKGEKRWFWYPFRVPGVNQFEKRF